MFGMGAMEVYCAVTEPLRRVAGGRSDVKDVEWGIMGTEDDEWRQREKINKPWRQKGVERGA